MINKKISYEKDAPQARFLMKQALQAGSFDEVRMGTLLCPVDAVCKLFSTNHSFVFDQFIIN